ncbi:MAG TPA: hypothetical protein VMT10_01860 [Solirubrobacteraceae bacterium]|nr:hypothetical protein [Solirubrobacteraceae bacterium]
MSTSRTAPRHRHDEAVVLRPARSVDHRALRRLAILDSAEPLAGEILVAERDGEILAAHELHGTRSIADPFVPTADLVDLLRARIALLHRAGAGRRARLGRRLGHPLGVR